MPNPDLIYLYTYGRLAAYRDLESWSLVVKDTETGNTHEMSMIEADPEEGMVAFLSEILESQPTANPTTALGVPMPEE